MADLALALPAVRRARGGSKVASIAVPACLVIAVIAWIVTVRHADYASMGSLGLVSILGPAYFAGLLFVCVGFAVELLRRRPSEGRLLAFVVVLVVYLFGTPCAIEPVAALTSSWAHAGYVRYVFVHGKALNGFDAEFSWPGVFSLFALMAGFMGKDQVIFLLRWFPLAIELAYLAPMLAIARASGVSRRAGWLGVALFFGTDWIYQDYFSPQAVNFLFYLSVVAVLLTCWRPVVALVALVARGRPTLRARWTQTKLALRAHRVLGYEATTDWPASLLVGIFVVLTLVFLASAMSHQLTPYAIFLALVACLFTRRLGRPELPLIAFLLAAGWLSLGASNYWLGHLSQIFGGIFQFGSTASANVSSRVVGSASHRLIVDVRILVTLGLFFLAGIGALRRATSSRTLELLTVVPFFVLAGQSYGGEGLLRVALLAGPFASLLAAAAILPSRSGSIRPFVRPLRLGRHGRTLLMVAAAVVLLGATVVTSAVRGGNDYYETFTNGELQAVNYTYAHVVPGETIGLVAPYEPIGQWYVGFAVRAYAVSANGTIPTQKQIRRALLHQHPSWIILGQAQQHWGEVLGGYPDNWMSALLVQLTHSGYHVRFTADDGTATVLFANHGGS